MNIDLGEIKPSDLKGKVFTLICEVVEGEGGEVYLKARHAYKLQRFAHGPHVALVRADQQRKPK